MESKDVYSLVLDLYKDTLNTFEENLGKGRFFSQFKRDILRKFLIQKDRYMNRLGFLSCDCCEKSSLLRWDQDCKKCHGSGWRNK